MKLPSLSRSRGPEASAQQLAWTATDSGLLFDTPNDAPLTPFIRRLATPEVSSLLEQLTDDDYAQRLNGTGIVIPWERLYELLQAKIYRSSLAVLDLPPLAPIVPELRSTNTLIDRDFDIGLSGWRHRDGTVAKLSGLQGGMVHIGDQAALLAMPVWKLLYQVSEFSDRPSSERTPDINRKKWARIRRLAIDADAVLDNFLVRSIVVLPEKLDIEFRKTDVKGTTLVEIMPGFEGAPARWLEYFDRHEIVPPYINIPTTEGAVHVAFSEPVQSVLRELKKLPNRRATGSRAEAFLLNPFSALGEDAIEVIDPNQFEAAKEVAGIQFERFLPKITMDAVGYPFEVGIAIDSPAGEAKLHIFSTDDELAAFVAGLATRLNRGMHLYAWRSYEFELTGDAKAYHDALAAALATRRKPPILIQHSRVYDLSSYSQRVHGIGEDEPFISPYIVKKTDENGWFPKNLLSLLRVRAVAGGPEITVPIDIDEIPTVIDAIAKAKDDGDATIRIQNSPIPLPLAPLEEAIKAIGDAIPALPPGVDPPGDPTSDAKKRSPTLLIKGNIDIRDHDEDTQGIPDAKDAKMERPRGLKPDVKLRDHQIAGVARMQQLFVASPQFCRGVLLADDMGLGKTLQILTFLVAEFERNPALPPALIVAPVALLENWKNEISNYFLPSAIRITMAYGEKLAELRVPRASVSADLQAEGLVKFLKPDWRANAQVVLTTYETLRDLEFSFALEPWSIMVCDEAQKIKNPNARVTRAAKKVNVRFRIACTGTPVENSLTDIWCLFDFIQPGLLDPLSAFGRNYGRPIEMRGADAQAKADELREKIAPQVIRRTKIDVAKDLPKKIEMPDCHLEFSNEQRALYTGVLQLFGQSSNDEGAKLHHLGVLQYLRLVSADPRRYGVERFVPEDPAVYNRKSPKMAWLLSLLKKLQADEAGEKILIFAEHRDVQRMLQYYIHSAIGVKPQIVNGDTAVSVKAEKSRQKIIDHFQASPGFNVIILSPLAVGFGVNIQAANHVVHFLRHWNPAKEDQATDRAYRIGQKRDVHVYCPLAIAKDFTTFDVKLDEMLRIKRALAGDMLMAAGTLSDVQINFCDIIPNADQVLKNEQVTMEHIDRYDPMLFEALIAALWKQQGFRTMLTPPSDAGVDVVSLGDGHGFLIQCKSSANSERALGWDAIKEVVGGTAVYGEKYPAVRFERLCVTNQRFNKTAHDRARANGVKLVERTGLAQALAKFPVKDLDVLGIAGQYML